MDIQFKQNITAESTKGSIPLPPQTSDLAQARDIAKKEFNASILESAINLSATDAPLSLVLKTALEGINQALKETLGDNAIQNSYESGLDVSPEATADRIVSISTGFFSLFHDQHPELSQEQALAAFIDVIAGGVNQGFAEARDILNGLHVLEGDIATNIDKTYDLVQDGLKSFGDNYEITDQS